MAIDPMLYEKLSGRKGDPRDRLGQVLAEDVKDKESRRAAKESPYSERQVASYFKAKAAAGVIGGVVMIVLILVARGCS